MLKSASVIVRRQWLRCLDSSTMPAAAHGTRVFHYVIGVDTYLRHQMLRNHGRPIFFPLPYSTKHALMAILFMQ